MIGNKLVKGGRNYAGEVGQTYFDSRRTFEDYLNGKGQLESEASLQTLYHRIRKAAWRRLRDTRKNDGGRERQTLSPEILERAAVSGDEDVREIMGQTLKAWAAILINIDLMINPELIVVGADITTENQYILTFAQRYVFAPWDVQTGHQAERPRRKCPADRRDIGIEGICF